jgi:hypothetical protein
MPQPDNIVLIVADSLRYDSLYHDGNPHTPYVNENAVQFSQARSSGCWTLPAHASMFTGLMPHEHGATAQTRRLNPSVPTLAERLKELGYRTFQVTANVVTTDIFGLDRGFDKVFRIWESVAPRFKSIYNAFIMLGKPRVRRMVLSRDLFARQLTEDLKVSKTWVQNTHKAVFKRAKRLLNQGKKRGERSFIFINLMETHFPYHIGPTFRLSARAWTDRLGELAGLFHMVNQSYLTDGKEHIPPRIGQILKRRQYKSWKLLSRPLDDFVRQIHDDQENLVVFASDHGDNFGEHGKFYHFTNVTDAGNRVPLFWIDHEHNGGRRLSHPVSKASIHDEILWAAGHDTGRPRLFDESPFNLPVLQSYWYNNHGRTLPEYKYNQMCFVDGDRRYLRRSGQWLTSPRQNDLETEAEFQPLPRGFDPVQEMVSDPERRQYLSDTIEGFEAFSSTIPM